MSSEKYIGLDVHQATISVAVMDSQGKVVMESILETKASRLLEFFGGLRGSLFVTFEEGTWAVWLYDLLKPHVTEVLVCNPRKIPLLKHGNKSDKIDARKLAERLRLHDLSRSTMVKPGYACCASWPEVISPWSKIFPV
jgi:transposase